MGQGLDFVTTEQFAPIVLTERQEPGALNLNDVQGLRDALKERVVSRPPAGSRQIFNFYYNPTTERFVIVIEGASETETQTISFKIAELAQLVMTITKTLAEHDVIENPLVDDYTIEHILETLENDLDAEL